MTTLQLLQSIHESGLSRGIRESGFFYPVVEGGHVLSLSLSVGMILWFDLRLTGLAMRGESVMKLYASLRPWIFTGFLSMLGTGVLLFIARSTEVWGSTYFRIKMLLLLMCLANVLVYHVAIGRPKTVWDTAIVPPASARVAGAVSLILWFSVIAMGRLVAYTL